MKISFRQNVWDNVGVFVGSKKLAEWSLQTACCTQDLAQTAVGAIDLGTVVEIPGHPAYPIAEQSDLDALGEILYRELAKGTISPGKPITLNVRRSRA